MQNSGTWVVTQNGDMMRIQALVVLVICNLLTSQPISHTKEIYDHLVNLDLPIQPMQKIAWKWMH